MKIDINDYSDIEDFWGILGFWGFFYGFSGGIYVLILWYLKGGVVYIMVHGIQVSCT